MNKSIINTYIDKLFLGIVKLIDYVPILKGKKTFIVILLQIAAYSLTSFNVVDQVAYLKIAAILGVVGTATGIAHPVPK